MTSLSAQISNLRFLHDRASHANLKRGHFCMRDSEADLIKERLSAAIWTLEVIQSEAPGLAVRVTG